MNPEMMGLYPRDDDWYCNVGRCYLCSKYWRCSSWRKVEYKPAHKPIISSNLLEKIKKEEEKISDLLEQLKKEEEDF